MKINLSLLLLGALLSTHTFAQALPSAPYVVVRGHAERNMIPDRFEISITVQKTSLDVGEASAVVESKTGAMVKSLKALGLKPTQITATNISINPEYRFDQTTQKNVFIGNQVNRNITAKFENKQTLQKFLAQVPAGEEVRIGGISSTLSTQKAVESELLDA
ncbi:MAG: SIMPL domain-containing protein, partial [Arenimonas sp.]|nr:SIMPL domain-containing protein [Arenimonas sp.]